jgi:hypothetical protein
MIKYFHFRKSVKQSDNKNYLFISKNNDTPKLRNQTNYTKLQNDSKINFTENIIFNKSVLKSFK